MVNTSINNPAQNSKEVLYFILLLATNESVALESATTAENTLWYTIGFFRKIL